jgi:protocatechuate 3,4-dioxygenase beta subunit
MRFRVSAALAVASTFGFGSFGQSQQPLESLPPANPQPSGFVGASSLLSAQANFLNQNQWIRMTDDGSVRGSVSMLVGTDHVRQGKVQVALIREGSAVAGATTDVEGDFMIEKIKPGDYSLVVEGEKQLAVCSLTVLTPEAGAHLPNRIHVRTVSPASPRVIELIRSNTMPTWTIGSDTEKDPIAESRKFEDTCEVEIDAQGGVSGLLSRPNAKVDLSGTVVYLIREGREVARTRASSNGAYRFDRVAPGGYGLVASGPEGIAAVGFCAVTNEYARVPSKTPKLVSQGRQDAAMGTAPHLNVELAQPNCYVPAEVIASDEIVEEAGACCPTMGGCCNQSAGWGGGGGGGAGAGGMGGWGLLAAGLGGAALGWAISDNSNNNQVPVVVSPIRP